MNAVMAAIASLPLNLGMLKNLGGVFQETRVRPLEVPDGFERKAGKD